MRFLKSFGEREPIALDDKTAEQLHTVDFKVVDDKVIVKARINGQKLQDFVLDTGSEQTTISRQTASYAGVRPITYTLSAGVGEVGLRGLQLGRLDSMEIGTLKLSNVPVMIKAPALRGLPKRETESFSPLSLGMSMIIDYGTQQAHHGPPASGGSGAGPAADAASPAVAGEGADQRRASDLLRDRHGRGSDLDQHRDGRCPQRGAGAQDWSAGLRHFGLGSRRVPAAGMRLRFSDAIDFKNFSLVVLNLRAPSVLLGFEVGGIVGHKFLSPYRVGLDMERSELRLSPAQSSND